MGAKNAQRTAKDHHYSFLPFLPTGLLAPASNASLKGRQVAYFFLLFATHYSLLITHFPASLLPQNTSWCVCLITPMTNTLWILPMFSIWLSLFTWKS